ncbi:MAG: hypothetical protein GC160_04895 [Acidobacteria bacterium]|nr:hypothetical protein [Acidobacteriota bacterium]
MRLPAALFLLAASLAAQTGFRDRMREIPADRKFTVADQSDSPEPSPNPKGWYHSVAGVAATAEGLVAVYRRSDSHTAVSTDIMVAYSADGGRTWTGHHSISHLDVWQDQAVWVAPQLSRLRDGRLVILVDRGQRRSGADWPMLASWQKPGRGMSNHVFWSHDQGRTWKGPFQIDAVGGEPGYIAELSDGTLLYTRTDSAVSDKLWNPPQPWGDIYYKNAAVLSDDGGWSWKRTASISDNPFQGDCEVGMAEVSPGRLLAATRIGFNNGGYGQPSRLIESRDGGRTWLEDDARLAPFYGQRVVLGKLASGKLLATYRHRWGGPGTYALVFDADERFEFQPSIYVWDESRVQLGAEALTIHSGEGPAAAVDYSLYPAQAPDSRVEVEAELRVEESEANGTAISAGAWVHILPDRVFLGDRPESGFALDATSWRRYRIVRDEGRLRIFVDGEKKLDVPAAGLETRYVHFGNRTGRYHQNRSLSHWRFVRARVDNAEDYSIDWSWTPSKGYPDQFRRSREVLLDRSVDSGYSSWTQLPDGQIVILDYTNESLESASSPSGPQTWIRAYTTTETWLTDGR